MPRLRTGFTTGACAAAATAAAVRALTGGEPVEKGTIHLPTAGEVSFALARCDLGGDWALCGVIKDAGDDPDVTHGAEIQAHVTWSGRPGIEIAGGEGVGMVTLPGLPVAVGLPAINPAPRRMIEEAARAALQAAGLDAAQSGLRVTIRVPHGVELAAQTMNPRLGILGGISILGTDGIVRPYSTPAYLASIHWELNVARQSGRALAVLATGKRSDAYARQELGLDDGPGVIDVGDHMGYALRQAARLKFAAVVISAMPGKASKLAQGRMQTHFSAGGVDFDFLAGLAAELDADQSVQALVRTARTAHQVEHILARAGVQGLDERLARLAARAAFDFCDAALRIEVLLFSIDGKLLARASEGT